MKKKIRYTASFSLILVLFWVAACGILQKVPSRNLIIILVDALRWDHLGVYGYKRNTSPHIDDFASQSLVFTQAISQSGWTAPAVMALFSSNYPKAHLNNSRTFAQWMDENDYQTAAFTANPIMIEKMGYNRGFRTYELRDWEKGGILVDLSLEWIRSRNPEKPFCLYLHLMDVHDPYKPKPPYDGKFGKEYNGRINGNIKPFKEKTAEGKALNLSKKDIQRLRDLYDGEIAYMDDQFARLLSGLKQAGVYEDSIIVFVSDHGDEFMEHNSVGHGHTVFEELIHVPLIIRGIDEKSRRYDGLFELIDLAPTLMDVMGVPFNYTVAGQSYKKVLKRNRPFKDIAFSEVHRTMGFNAGNWSVSARTETKKIIYYPHERKYDFFDLIADPYELSPLDDEQDSANYLKRSLQNWRKIFGSTSKFKPYDDDEYKEALRSLGYIK